MAAWAIRGPNWGTAACAAFTPRALVEHAASYAPSSRASSAPTEKVLPCSRIACTTWSATGFPARMLLPAGHGPVFRDGSMHAAKRMHFGLWKIAQWFAMKYVSAFFGEKCENWVN